jgi:hypothetical protein
METIKSVGRSGQISLGKKFAGKTVLIDQIEPGVWVVKLGQFIPDSEKWLHDPRSGTKLTRPLPGPKKIPSGKVI